MICPNCKKQIDGDSNFCKYCGSKVIVANKCPHCGATPLPKDAKFCPDCGMEVFITANNNTYYQAYNMAKLYPDAYRFYVRQGSLPNFSPNLSNAELARIISWKKLLEKKQSEIQYD